MELNAIRTLLLDGDGVLWRAGEPMPGLTRFFETLHRHGIRWGLLTNNSGPTTDDHVRKLNSFGVSAGPENIISSAIVTAEYLAGRFKPGSPVYVIGQPGLKRTLAEAGFAVSDGDTQPEHADAVVVGIDLQFSYARLSVAMRLIGAGARFIATNPDTSFPTPNGLTPGAGSLVAAVAAASGRQPEMMGKPEPTMFHVALARLQADPAATVMVGDRLDTDILGAHNIGLKAICVLSGISSRADIERQSITPDWIMDDIGALADQLDRAAST